MTKSTIKIEELSAGVFSVSVDGESAAGKSQDPQTFDIQQQFRRGYAGILKRGRENAATTNDTAHQQLG